MKKHILAAVLCAALLLALLPGPARAEDRLSLVSVNDKLPPELINVIVVYSGLTYVPSWLFTNYALGVSYTYLSAQSTVCLSSGARHLYFDLANARTYDDDDYTYSTQAIMWGGTVYLPLSFVSSFFGTFIYSNIGGNEYGTILRITTGSEVLTNEEFLAAAQPAMKRYYDAYYKAQETPEPSQPSQTPTPPRPSAGPEPLPHEGDTVRLGLEGMPSKEVLELLRRLNMRACFFLTAEEVRTDPDAVREIACTGNTLGVACGDGGAAAYAETAALLWECARICVILATAAETEALPETAIALPSAGAAPQEEAEEALWALHAVTAQMERSRGDRVVIFPLAEDDLTELRMLLYALRDQGYTVTALRETEVDASPVVPG